MQTSNKPVKIQRTTSYEGFTPRVGQSPNKAKNSRQRRTQRETKRSIGWV